MLPTLNVAVEKQGILFIMKNWKIDTYRTLFNEKEDLIYQEIVERAEWHYIGILRCFFFMQKKKKKNLPKNMKDWGSLNGMLLLFMGK